MQWKTRKGERSFGGTEFFSVTLHTSEILTLPVLQKEVDESWTFYNLLFNRLWNMIATTNQTIDKENYRMSIGYLPEHMLEVCFYDHTPYETQP